MEKLSVKCRGNKIELVLMSAIIFPKHFHSYKRKKASLTVPKLV